MASGRSKVPWFDGYLAAKYAEPTPSRARLADAMGCGLFALGLPLLAVTPIALRGEWWMALVLPLIGIPIFAGVWATIRKRADMPRTSEEERQKRLREVLQSYFQLRQNKRLHKWIDPVALQLLEAGAFHWSRLRESLNGPFWMSPNLPTHYMAIRDQALASAEQGMAEMVTLAQSCIGKPEKDKKRDVESVFESFFDLEVADALSGLKQIAHSDWTKYSYHTEASRGIFEPCRQIAERLKELADEIETVKVQAAMQQVVDNRAASTDSLNLVLEELRAVKKAETELEEQQHLEL
jgi:ribosomal protein L29